MRRGWVHSHDMGYAMRKQHVQRNPRELLYKSHDDTVAQEIVYIATLQSVSIYVYCLL